ncbi:hypothetical protein FQA39_LY14629 [Lamprigera yunnana]|nr:hypothetical protein FQA39_LY14629 [Lamprigera yunnana]
MHARRVSAFRILDINRDTEVLNSYVLTNTVELDKESIEDQKNPLKALKLKQESHCVPTSDGSKKLKEEKRVGFAPIKPEDDVQNENQKDAGSTTAATKERATDETGKDKTQKEEQPKKAKKKVDPRKIKEEIKKKRKRRKRPKPEELYTDKDRAAAVNMGNRDIKQSLKIKRRQDRSKNLQISEESEPTTFLGLANFEMNKEESELALTFLNKALELNPTDKNCLVARSRCFLLLGQPQNGLKDAEAALAIDKTFMKAVYQKAESLYYLGDFEHSLMYHHRGLRIRPDFEGFRLGIQKAQKAIENAICGATNKSRKSSTLSLSTKSSVKNKATENAAGVSSNVSTLKNTPEPKFAKGTPKSTQRSTSTVRSTTACRNNSKLLRELKVDKEYLDNLLKRPDLKSKNSEEDSTIVGYIKDAVNFLNIRQEFWRQQLPTK